MKLYIDADGCPVVDAAIRIAGKLGVPCFLVCDTAHHFARSGAATILVGQGADSADFKLVNLLCAGDIAVTQDYGLAAMCLSKRAVVLNQDGKEYTDENISGLLAFRATAKKIRSGGGRLKGPPKRTAEQDLAFEKSLRRILTQQT